MGKFIKMAMAFAATTIFPGCSKLIPCNDAGGTAIVSSMKDHPEDWEWDGWLFLTNEKAGISFWKHDLNINGNLSTYGCRLAIDDAANPIRERDEEKISKRIKNKLAAQEPRP